MRYRDWKKYASPKETQDLLNIPHVADYYTSEEWCEATNPEESKRQSKIVDELYNEMVKNKPELPPIVSTEEVSDFRPDYYLLSHHQAQLLNGAMGMGNYRSHSHTRQCGGINSWITATSHSHASVTHNHNAINEMFELEDDPSQKLYDRLRASYEASV